MSGAAAVRVPGSTSNLGPGFDALGLALSRALIARFEPDGDALEVVRLGTLAQHAAPGPDLAVDAFRSGFEPGSVPGGLLTLDSEIPVARGMGSSAAALVAGRYLADRVRGREPDREAILRRTVDLEGHPDNAVPALFGGLVAAMTHRGRVLWTHLPLSPEVGLVFGDPGVELATAEARRVLPRRVSHADAAGSGARVALLLHGLAVADPDLVAAGLDDVLHVPYRMPLVPGAVAGTRAALDAGAWGVTLSGSGSGLLALGPRDRMPEVAEALAAGFRGAGVSDARAYEVRPDPHGARPELSDGPRRG
jgi:homoserine kinase